MIPYPVFLETDRLLLRRFTREDALLLHKLDSDPEVMRYISGGRPTPLEHIERDVLTRWLRYYEEYEHLGFWAAHEKDGGGFIGWFHLRPERYAPHDPEIGYRLRRRAWGRGYATEGSKALIERAFTEWGVEKIVATALAGNAASRRVMEKCGLQFEQAFVYEERLLPGWTEEQRQAVRYGLDRRSFLHSKQP